jgi:hypothetical protein
VSAGPSLLGAASGLLVGDGSAGGSLDGAGSGSAGGSLGGSGTSVGAGSLGGAGSAGAAGSPADASAGAGSTVGAGIGAGEGSTAGVGGAGAAAGSATAGVVSTTGGAAEAGSPGAGGSPAASASGAASTAHTSARSTASNACRRHAVRAERRGPHMGRSRHRSPPGEGKVADPPVASLDTSAPTLALAAPCGKRSPARLPHRFGTRHRRSVVTRSGTGAMGAPIGGPIAPMWRARTCADG